MNDINNVNKIIEKECDKLKNLLIQKNTDYGNSAINPLRIFSSASSLEQIKVRMDDKLSRIKNLQEKENKVKSETIEDTMFDLAGYIILYFVAKNIQGKNNDVRNG